MRSFIGGKPGRMLVVHLKKGEFLLESIEEELKRQNIKHAVLLSCIGSLRKAVFHYIVSTDDLATDKFLTLERPIELAAVQGLVLDGKAHFHMVLSDDDKTYTGHLEEGCEIQYLAEISLLEIENVNLERRTDEFGILYIDEKK